MKKLIIIFFVVLLSTKIKSQIDSTLKDSSIYTMKVLLTQNETGDSVRVNCRNCSLTIYFTKSSLPIVNVKEDFKTNIDTTIKKHK